MAAHSPRLNGPRRERGVSLVMTLIVLVAMMIASVALVRSMDTSMLILGNMAFRQGATVAGDSGVEAARAWLIANGSSLEADSSANGYYATSQDSLDVTGGFTEATSDNMLWDGSGATKPRCLATDTAGNTACYVIHRMCRNTGALTATECAVRQAFRGGSSLGATRPMETYQERSWTQVAIVGYYRVTVRVAGPRNNTSFIQTFLVI